MKDILVVADTLRRRQAEKRAQLLMRARVLLKERRTLTTEAFVDPVESAWHTLYKSRHQGSFIAIVSLSPEAFDELLNNFARY